LTRPYLLRRQGVMATEPLKVQVPAGFDWPIPGNRREYLRGRLENGQAIIYKNQSSGVLRSAAWADGLVEVLEGRTLALGDIVHFIPLSEVLS
jgi:molybdopterin molybdotransferase